MRAQIYLRAGAIAHVVTTDAADFGGPRVEEGGPAGPIALELRELVLEDANGAPPARFIQADELRAALELRGGRPAIRADAPAELRALRLVDRGAAFSDGTRFDDGFGLVDGPGAVAGGAAALEAPQSWAQRALSWWKGTP